MGCAAATARRRRKQAVNGYRHLPKQRRPKYKVRTEEANAKRLNRLRERQQMIQARKGRQKL